MRERDVHTALSLKQRCICSVHGTSHALGQVSTGGGGLEGIPKALLCHLETSQRNWLLCANLDMDVPDALCCFCSSSLESWQEQEAVAPSCYCHHTSPGMACGKGDEAVGFHAPFYVQAES